MKNTNIDHLFLQENYFDKSKISNLILFRFVKIVNENYLKKKKKSRKQIPKIQEIHIKTAPKFKINYILLYSLLNFIFILDNTPKDCKIS